MQSLIDMHIHTIASGHATGTITDVLKSASQKGLRAVAITDHAPKMMGTTRESYFRTLKLGCSLRMGVEILYGVELNLDNSGNIDLPQDIIKNLDICLVALHPKIFKSLGVEENTDAVLKILKNKSINVLAHLDDGSFPLDYDKIMKTASENRVAIEINNASLKDGSYRKDSKQHLLEMISFCKKYNNYIVLGSDSHFPKEVGDLTLAEEFLEAEHYPQNLVLNYSIDKFKSFISK